ncbi:FAD-dependent oxidoreductase [Caldiplasma sukawensis]
MKIVVIGGGAAGMSAASKAKRIDPSLEITVLESGNFVSYGECGIPYYLSEKFQEPERLLHYPIEEFTVKRKIDVKIGTSVNGIDFKNHKIFTNMGEIYYDKLIISTGARAQNPFSGVAGVFSVRTLDEAIMIRKAMKGKRIGIIGDGILGTELASEFLMSGFNVTLYSKHKRILREFSDSVKDELENSLRSKIKIFYDISIDSIDVIQDSLFVNGDKSFGIHDFIIVCTGITPNTEFLINSGLAMDRKGYIMVNNRMETNIQDVYAAGDCALSINRITGKNFPDPAAQVANKMGRVAGSNAAGVRMEFKGSLRTTVVKILDYELGKTGLSIDEAEIENFSPKKIEVKTRATPLYYGDNGYIYLQVIYDQSTGRLLGGQICSKTNGAWRLNTLETAIYAGMTIDDLFYNDMGYTPPFGPVWDPIIIAASLSMRD